MNRLYVDIEEADKNNVNFHREFRTVTLYLCIRCVLMRVIFLCAAIYFDKWWILLGTLCFAGGASMENDTPEKSKRGKEEEI